MAFDEQLADRIRDSLSDQPGVSERKMFGGVAFMVNGNMAVGVSNADLMVRAGDATEPLLATIVWLILWASVPQVTIMEPDSSL